MKSLLGTVTILLFMFSISLLEKMNDPCFIDAGCPPASHKKETSGAQPPIKTTYNYNPAHTNKVVPPKSNSHNNKKTVITNRGQNPTATAFYLQLL